MEKGVVDLYRPRPESIPSQVASAQTAGHIAKPRGGKGSRTHTWTELLFVVSYVYPSPVHPAHVAELNQRSAEPVSRMTFTDWVEGELPIWMAAMYVLNAYA